MAYIDPSLFLTFVNDVEPFLYQNLTVANSLTKTIMAAAPEQQKALVRTKFHALRIHTSSRIVFSQFEKSHKRISVQHCHKTRTTTTITVNIFKMPQICTMKHGRIITNSGGIIFITICGVCAYLLTRFNCIATMCCVDTETNTRTMFKKEKL